MWWQTVTLLTILSLAHYSTCRMAGYCSESDFIPVFCMIMWISLTILSHVTRKPVLPYANSKGEDQPAHPHSLISSFVIHRLDNIIPLLAVAGISSLCSWADRFESYVVANPEDRFSRNEAQFWYTCLDMIIVLLDFISQYFVLLGLAHQQINNCLFIICSHFTSLAPIPVNFPLSCSYKSEGFEITIRLNCYPFLLTALVIHTHLYNISFGIQLAIQSVLHVYWE